MSNLKRFLALALVVMMAIGGLAMNVSAIKAADVDAVAQKELAYAIDVLSDLGVVKGVSENEDGTINFGGDAIVTRAQFALFTSRISTAHPEWFAPGQTGSTVKTKFEDANELKDLDVYAAAINYCVDEGIINGYPDGSFAPKNGIMLQEAVKMLVTALKYTGLSYPIGYLERANEPEVALIGAYAPFTMRHLNPSDELTRDDMAMLLYNFLMSAEYRIKMTQNVPGGALEAVPDPLYILEKFGFTRIVGYVTGIPGWAANIKALNEYGQAIVMPGTIMAPKTTFSSINANDLEVSWIINYTTNYSQSRMIKDKVGLADWDYEELLGLKVQLYLDNRVNPAKAIQIPAKLMGDKIEVKASLNDSSYNLVDAKNAVKDVNWLKLGISDEASETYTQQAGGATFNDFKDWNLYMFRKDSAKMIDSGIADPVWEKKDGVEVLDKNGDKVRIGWDTKSPWGILQESTVLNEFAKFVNADNKANYRLEYVDNGTHLNGTPDFFYVFRPFQVGVRRDDADGHIRFLMDASSGDGVKVGSNMAAADARFMDDTVKAVDKGSAYFFTAYGNKLDIYGQLAETKKAIPSYVQGGNATFRIGTDTKNVTFGFSTSLSKALGAFSEARGRIVNAKEYEYSLFADANGAILTAYQTAKPADVPDYTASKYAVVISATSGDVILPGTMISGRTVKVTYADTGADDTIFVASLNGGAASGLAKGMFICLGADNKVFTAGYDGFINSKEYFGYTATGANQTVYNQTTKLLSFTADIPTETVGTPPVTQGVFTRATVSSGTKIVVYSTAAEKAYVYGSNDTQFYNALASAGNVLITVAKAPQIAPANYIYLYTAATIYAPAPAITGYAILQNTPEGKDGFVAIENGDWYWLGKAGKDGTNVGNKTSGLLSGGELVKVTTAQVTDEWDATKYNVVDVLDTSLKGAAADVVAKIITATNANSLVINSTKTIASGGVIIDGAVKMYFGKVDNYIRNSGLRLTAYNGATPLWADLTILNVDSFRLYSSNNKATGNVSAVWKDGGFRHMSDKEWAAIATLGGTVYGVIYTDASDNVISGSLIVVMPGATLAKDDGTWDATNLWGWLDH